MNENILSLTDALASDLFTSSKAPMTCVFGKAEDGNCVIDDLEKFPHLVIAGATGTGKSTLAHHIILSVIRKTANREMRMLLCDTKMLELSRYNGIPHLLIPAVTDIRKIVGSLHWLNTEAQSRTKQIRDAGCRSFREFNDHAWEIYKTELPHILVVIDDAALVAQSDDARTIIATLAQIGRSVGIHLVLITQAPSSKSISSIIRDYIPVRAVFSVICHADEQLLLGHSPTRPCDGTGRFVLYNAPARHAENIRCFNVTDYTLNDALSGIEPVAPYIEPVQPDLPNNNTEPKEDEMLPAAVDIILETGIASVSIIQRRLKLGYARAARLIDMMEEQGIVGPFQGSKPRAILITKQQR